MRLLIVEDDPYGDLYFDAPPPPSLLALSESVALGDWRLWFAMRDWIEAVSPADVQRIAQTWLLPANRDRKSVV